MHPEFVQVNERRQYRFCSFFHSGTEWVVLVDLDGNFEFNAWQRVGPAAELTRSELITDVVTNSELTPIQGDLLFVFIRQRPGWVYWGSGIPLPLRDYFRNELEALIDAHRVA